MIRHEELREEGLSIFATFESLYFEAQGGFMRQNTESTYQFTRSEEFIKYLSELGITQYWTHFFKGYGLDFEKEGQRHAIELAQICHKHGIKLIAYVSIGSVTPEVLLSSNPEAEDWIVKSVDGRKAQFLQSFRTKPCYTSREYINHIKQVVDRAFEYGCDGIHFDNMGWPLDTDGCRCERCVALFREYLSEKYGTRSEETRKAGRLRFGRNTFDRATPPFRNTNEDLGRLSVANEQEWRLFKMKVLSGVIAELAEHIRSQGKLVEFNALWGPFVNHARYGLHLHQVLSQADMVFYEGGPKAPSYNNHGSPLTRIRSYKICAE